MMHEIANNTDLMNKIRVAASTVLLSIYAITSCNTAYSKSIALINILKKKTTTQNSYICLLNCQY